jgi:hypothetical protein
MAEDTEETDLSWNMGRRVGVGRRINLRTSISTQG